MNQYLASSLTPEFLAGIYDLLALQVKHYHAHYHMGDNTSVPEETARELMESIRYTLDKVDLSGMTPAAALARGQEILKKQLAETRKLYTLVCATMPPFASESYQESLGILGKFLDRYDFEHFAHRTPAFLLYPLLTTAWQELKGIDQAECYLRCLWQENQILAAPVDAEAVYQEPGFWDAPNNLCEPLLKWGLQGAIVEELCRNWNITSPDAVAYARLAVPCPSG